MLDRDFAVMYGVETRVLADYNDFVEDTRTQLELINQTIAEMQTSNK